MGVQGGGKLDADLRLNRLGNVSVLNMQAGLPDSFQVETGRLIKIYIFSCKRNGKSLFCCD